MYVRYSQKLYLTKIRGKKSEDQKQKIKEGKTVYHVSKIMIWIQENHPPLIYFRSL